MPMGSLEVAGLSFSRNTRLLTNPVARTAWKIVVYGF
jgi:hypothetical protein